MHEYGLTSEEGVILMCLAEALLRIPDKDTTDALIAEKIGSGRWEEASRRLRQSVRQCLDIRTDADGQRRQIGRRQRASGPAGILKRLLARFRRAVHSPGGAAGRAHPGRQFRARPHDQGSAGARGPLEAKGYRFSYDMLGERRARRTTRRATSIAISAPWRRSARRRDRAPGLQRRAVRSPKPLGQVVGDSSALRSERRIVSDGKCCRVSSNWPGPHADTISP